MRPHLSRQLVAPARLQELAELAEAVADEHCPAGGGRGDTTALDPLRIAAANGISVSVNDYGDAFDGMLEYGADGFHIYCNRRRCGDAQAPRARFTLAHELAHYYIDEHRLVLTGGVPAHRSVCDHESPNLAEQEADRFAAAMLMPAPRFRTAARRAGRGIDGILALARLFNTSITSTAIRYAELDIAPCAVIKWDWAGYAWKRLSASSLAGQFRRTIDTAAQLMEGSPTRQALAREPVPPAGYWQAGTTAAAWFVSMSHDNPGNAILVEQAIPLGQFGVLALLYPA